MLRLGFEIKISGLVQGVGFRPLIFKIAHELNIFGEVKNDGFGVLIYALCTQEICQNFIKKIKENLPPLSRIDEIRISKIKLKNYLNFSISKSLENTKSAPILSDFGICNECKNELFEPKNPRFLYPFITCTNCGPRFSIIKNLPYDRQKTTMSELKMCEFCQNEYKNPRNRRFHAQPLSCKKCEIKLFLKDKNGQILESSNKAIKQTTKLLKNGQIVAIKGLGGFHLMCDALNENAVNKLRIRKNRPKKPFAIMCKNLESAQKIAFINKNEARILQSQLAPIVLLKMKKSAQKKLVKIAPDIDKIGIMLPYTGLQLLLFENINFPLVATSANLSGEGIIFDETILRQKLSKVFDFYLTYEREIQNPSDDSIVQILGKKTMFLRTSRGINPIFLKLNFSPKISANILALGAELKNQFAIFYANKILISPYLGDLKSVDVSQRFNKLLTFFKQNYELEFDIILRDLHPNFSYPVDEKNAKKSGEKAQKQVKIQHHYAHFCAAFFEYQKEFKAGEKALGFIFDGTGFGDDGKIWGGEILFGDLNDYKRITHFDNFTLINSDIKNIQNLALAALWHYNLKNEAKEFLAKIPAQKLENLKKIHAKSKLQTSSLGRIIDAFGALVFDLEKSSYEAQVGLMCEKFYDKNLNFSYKLSLQNGVINFKEILTGALKDPPRVAVSGFLNALANFIIEFSDEFRKNQPNIKILLNGGVFQNKTLLEILRKKGFKFLVPLRFPCNDSSIALGQMAHFLHKN